MTGYGKLLVLTSAVFAGAAPVHHRRRRDSSIVPAHRLKTLDEGTEEVQSATCFNMQPLSLDDAPFSNETVANFRRNFMANMNWYDTGGIIASPGLVPALAAKGIRGGYRFHWMRDGALSIKSLIDTADLTDKDVRKDVLRTVRGYVRWVAETSAGSDDPKWNMTTRKPYDDSWCKPQTDGRPLRATTMMSIMDSFPGPVPEAWALAKEDLNWISSDPISVNGASCDLWEEDMKEPNLLWNRVVARSALLSGAKVAQAKGDVDGQARYEDAAAKLGDPWADHHIHEERGYFTECPTESSVCTDLPPPSDWERTTCELQLDGGMCSDRVDECQAGSPCYCATTCGYCVDQCVARDKGIDGAVILALIHANSAKTEISRPDSQAVARTIRAYNKAFCKAYPVNNLGLPGILYGRFTKDDYGGGNPWVITTSAVANLLYRASLESSSRIHKQQPLADETVSQWRATFGEDFGSEESGGLPQAFIAAGDSVLRRLRMHVSEDGDHLFEQLLKEDGKQYNAQDLTWSYAETLNAIHQRTLAVASVSAMREHPAEEVADEQGVTSNQNERSAPLHTGDRDQRSDPLYTAPQKAAATKQQKQQKRQKQQNQQKKMQQQQKN